MADQKTERKLTSYIILAGSKAAFKALEVGRVDAGNAKAGVQFAADPADPKEVYVAVPVSSFNVFEGQVEQPPPVFKFTELGEKTEKPAPAEPKPTPVTPAQETLTEAVAAGREALKDNELTAA